MTDAQDTESVLLDLFAGLGGFSQAFEDADGWEVVTVDIQERFGTDITADVMDLRPSDLPDADVVLASPPCTCFSLAANGHHEHFDGQEPLTDDARDAVALVYHTLGLIRSVSPEWWWLENPRGKLRKVLGRPEGTVSLCQYGYGWQKPTDLWGRHPTGFEYRTCSPGDDCHAAGPSGFDGGDDTTHERDPAERAKLPRELSEAILNAVEGRTEQTALTEVRA
jgi:hypothetical protein